MSEKATEHVPEKHDPFGGARTFVQTAQAALPELDHWQQITDEEVAIASDMVRRNELSGGTPVVREFEKTWCDWTGSKYAITVVNGTSALYSAYFGLGVGPGDEVICPVNTWICSISPALLMGARPVFCDIDPETLLLDPDDVRAKVSDKTRCICAVHLWGLVCDMDAIMDIGREFGIPVVEDCSHAHGAKYKGRICGAIGDAGCWSLQGSKPVSAGEGGVMVTDDTDAFERACIVGQVNRIKGVDLVTAKYEALQPLGLGMKFRAHPLGIGIASEQLKKLPDLNRKRGAYIREVEEGLAGIPGLRPIGKVEGGEWAGFYGFPIIHEPAEMGMSTGEFVEAVKVRGLQVKCSPYPNLHELPLFAKGFDIWTRNRGPLSAGEGYRGYQPGDFPRAEFAAKRTVFLPVLTDPVPEAPRIVLDVLRRAARGE